VTESGAPGASADGSLVGRAVDTVTLDVERGKVAEFVRATHVTAPAHTEVEAAHRAGLADLAATPTHLVVAGHQRDPSAWVTALGLDRTRVVVGGTSWEYVRPLVVGDRVTGHRVVVGDETRTGSSGTLRIITLETTWTDTAGEVVTRGLESIIERGRS
jgi:acyl dehydratase